MIKLINRIKYKLPKHIKDIWWNRSVHMDEKFPIVSWQEIGYLNCKKGLIIPMRQLSDGNYAYYKVIKITWTRGSDWLYPSDAINCDLKFDSIKKELGVGGYIKEKSMFLVHTPR